MPNRCGRRRRRLCQPSTSSSFSRLGGLARWTSNPASRARDIVRGRIAAQGHESMPLRRRVGPHAPRDLVAVHPRQPDVAQHDVGPERARLREAVGAVVRHLDLCSLELEHLAQALGGVGVVLDDEHAPALAVAADAAASGSRSTRGRERRRAAAP